MTVANILLYIALIGYVLYLRVQGRPVKEGRRLFVLPVVLVVIGYGDITHGVALKPVELTLVVIAGVISFGLGMLRGRTDKLSDRDGYPFVQWGVASLSLFAVNIAVKLILDLIGIAAGGTSAAVMKSLVLTFGLTLLGEAVVLRMRTTGIPGISNPAWATGISDAANRKAPTPPSEPVPSGRYQHQQQPAATNAQAQGVADALSRHHSDHRARHQERRDQRRARHGRNS